MADLRESLVAEHVTLLERAISPAERRHIRRRLADRLRISEARAYELTRQGGWASGRTRRADAGTSSLDEAVLTKAAGILGIGVNKKGRCTITERTCYELLVREGDVDPSRCSYATFARVLRQQHRSRVHVTAPAPAVHQVYERPNHVWFLDYSICLHWKMDSGRLTIDPDAARNLNANKLDKLAEKRQYVWRYLGVDAFSGSWFVYYYLTTGEIWSNVVDFLFRMMHAKARPDFPLHGIPKRIIFDQGSANKKHEVVNLLEGLGVDVHHHKTGNAKASGTVERRHRGVEEDFEGLLTLEKPGSMEELNRLAEGVSARLQLTRPLVRNGVTGPPPSQRWLTIRDDQIIEAPDWSVFEQLATSKRRRATVDRYNDIRADGRRWHVDDPEVFPGQKLDFRVTPLLAEGIRVWDEQGRELAVHEYRINKATGDILEGQRVHFVDHKSASVAARPAQKIVEAARSGETPIVLKRSPLNFDGAELHDARTVVMQRRGQAWTPPASLQRAVEFDHVTAREEALRRLGQARLTPDEATWWKARAERGLTRPEFEAAYTEFTTGSASMKEAVK